MQHTKEEKVADFKSLRERWAKNKALAETDNDAKKHFEAMQAESPSGISYTGYYFTLVQMREQNLEGLPYVDCKTFQGWKQAGFQVKKGEHSKIEGITWVAIEDKNGEDEEYVYPKVYKLFHKSQVEVITK